MRKALFKPCDNRLHPECATSVNVYCETVTSDAGRVTYLAGHMPIKLAMDIYSNWEFVAPDFESTFERERRLEAQRAEYNARHIGTDDCPF